MTPRVPRGLKRADLMVDQIKRWIIDGQAGPGDRLPNEADLQRLFGMSKGTVREALKSLEIQGLVRLRAGPGGGATITEVGFNRAFQLLQNHFFFQPVDMVQIYQMRRLLEPELAAIACQALTDSQLHALEQGLEACGHDHGAPSGRVAQGAEDLDFHDMLARACPNALMRFQALAINEMLRRVVIVSGDLDGLAALNHANGEAHRAILTALRARDADAVRAAMLAHIDEAAGHVARMDASYRQRLVLDQDVFADLRLSGVDPLATSPPLPLRKASA